MLTIGHYGNYNRHLPHKQGRLWFEADLDYKNGKRNKKRILWSNDGYEFEDDGGQNARMDEYLKSIGIEE